MRRAAETLTLVQALRADRCRGLPARIAGPRRGLIASGESDGALSRSVDATQQAEHQFGTGAKVVHVAQTVAQTKNFADLGIHADLLMLPGGKLAQVTTAFQPDASKKLVDVLELPFTLHRHVEPERRKAARFHSKQQQGVGHPI